MTQAAIEIATANDHATAEWAHLGMASQKDAWPQKANLSQLWSINFFSLSEFLEWLGWCTLSQQNHSLKTIGGERPKGYIQVHVVVHQVTFWIEEFCRELIALLLLFQSTTPHIYLFFVPSTRWIFSQKEGRCLNSLTPKCIPVGTKYSRWEDFYTNIPTMMCQFPV